MALILSPNPTPAPPPLISKLITLRLLGFAPVGADAPAFYSLLLSYFLYKLTGLDRPAPLVWWWVFPVPTDFYTSPGNRSMVQPLSRWISVVSHKAGL